MIYPTFSIAYLIYSTSHRGVTDLYLSWGINIEHARTAYHKTCGTEYQQLYRRCNSQTPYCTYMSWNKAQARPMSVLRTTQLAKLSFNHPSVVLTVDVFQYKKTLYQVSGAIRTLSHHADNSGTIETLEISDECFIYYKMKNEDFIETHLCKLRGIFRSRALRV